jgi:hypothetical protein
MMVAEIRTRPELMPADGVRQGGGVWPDRLTVIETGAAEGNPRLPCPGGVLRSSYRGIPENAAPGSHDRVLELLERGRGTMSASQAPARAGNVADEWGSWSG